MLTRRRFLAIAACAAATPAFADNVHEWTGQAMGASARVALRGCDDRQAHRLFRKVESVLRQVEGHFSLHRESELTRLNRDGRLTHPDRSIVALFNVAGAVHGATGGAFDPSVQPLWLATALDGDIAAARESVGWARVRVSADEISLDPGMALTFNGIAQGHAADRVADLIRQNGFTDVLIDMGEIMGLGQRPGGGGWRAAINMVDGRTVAHATLSNRALATSSPRGTLIGGGKAHIVSPTGSAPLWQLASVSASSAALADALSTAFCLMERPAIARALAAFPEAALESLI